MSLCKGQVMRTFVASSVVILIRQLSKHYNIIVGDRTGISTIHSTAFIEMHWCVSRHHHIVRYHLWMKTILNSSFFSAMSRERRRFLPAPDALWPVHPVWQRAVRVALGPSTALSTGSALEPICTTLWLARTRMLQCYQPCDLHATSDDDDNEDIWAEWSVVINSWRHHDLETLSALQALTKGQKFEHMTIPPLLDETSCRTNSRVATYLSPHNIHVTSL